MDAEKTVDLVAGASHFILQLPVCANWCNTFAETHRKVSFICEACVIVELIVDGIPMRGPAAVGFEGHIDIFGVVALVTELSISNWKMGKKINNTKNGKVNE